MFAPPVFSTGGANAFPARKLPETIEKARRGRNRQRIVKTRIRRRISLPREPHTVPFVSKENKREGFPMRITYLGQCGFLIEAAGTRIVTDPYLSDYVDRN